MVKYWALENFKEDVKIQPPKGFNSWTQIPNCKQTLGYWVAANPDLAIRPLEKLGKVLCFLKYQLNGRLMLQIS